MNSDTYFQNLKSNTLPVIVDIWAPWCGPCMLVKPVLEGLAEEYSGRVVFWEINADDNQDLLGKLGVFGIPTLIIYRDGNELHRYIGAKPVNTLRSLFEAVSSGNIPEPSGISLGDRLLRFGAGLVIVGIGLAAKTFWIPAFVGGLFLFSAVYDRCPIWRTISSRLKKLSIKAQA